MATTSRSWFGTKYPAEKDIVSFTCNLILEKQPLVIVEFGSGYSTVKMAEASDGVVYAYEHQEKYAERTRRALKSSGLVAHVNLCELANGFYKVPAYPKNIGLVFVDGPPSHDGNRTAALPSVWQNLADDWVCIVDDGNRKSAEADVKEWCEQLPVDARYVNMKRGMWVVTPK